MAWFDTKSENELNTVFYPGWTLPVCGEVNSRHSWFAKRKNKHVSLSPHKCWAKERVEEVWKDFTD